MLHKDSTDRDNTVTSFIYLHLLIFIYFSVFYTFLMILGEAKLQCIFHVEFNVLRGVSYIILCYNIIICSFSFPVVYMYACNFNYDDELIKYIILFFLRLPFL